MNVTLVFPPCADPALPYGSLPLLGAVLKRAGYRNVTIRDINLEAFDDLVRVEPLRDALSRARRQLRSLERQSVMTEPDAHRKSRLQYALQSPDEILDNINHAREVLRDPQAFFQPSSLLFAKRIFHMACMLLSAPYPQAAFGKYSYSNASYDSFDEIQQALEDDEGALLSEYFRTVAVPSILAGQPQVVGIAVPYFSQLIPTFLLAKLLKERNPALHITIGGPVPTWGKHVLGTDARFGRWLDSVAIGEADQTFLELVEALDGKGERAQVRNFLHYEDGRVVERFDPSYQVDMNWLPTPDFAALPLDRYFAPQRIMCMVPARGCYYNLCTFCNYAFIKIAPYRVRDPHLVAQDVQQIVDQTGEDVFCFESDVMLPRYLKLLSQAFVDRNVNIRWHAVARFERGMPANLFKLMREAGCVRLYMGMESVNQRVLDLMDKGTTKARVAEILDHCYEAGIALEAGVFGNFPTETPQEAEETYRFVKEHRHKLARCDVGEFRLLRGTPIAAEPARFNVQIIGDPQQKWYHLDFVDPTPRPYKPGVATPMQKIQALYPEVAFVDVPEDILYTAAYGPNVFGRLFSRADADSVQPVDPDACPVASDAFLVIKAYVANSGSIVFIDPSSELHEHMPAFASSEIPLLFALNRDLRMLYPLTQTDLLTIQYSDGNTTFAEIRRRIMAQYEGDEDETELAAQCDVSFHSLLDNEVLSLVPLPALAPVL